MSSKNATNAALAAAKGVQNATLASTRAALEAQIETIRNLMDADDRIKVESAAIAGFDTAIDALLKQQNWSELVDAIKMDSYRRARLGDTSNTLEAAVEKKFSALRYEAEQLKVRREAHVLQRDMLRDLYLAQMWKLRNKINNLRK